MNKYLIFIAFLFCETSFYEAFISSPKRFISYQPNSEHDLVLFWRDERGQPYHRFETLKNRLAEQDKKLVFAMNAGIFQADSLATPLGLYIEQGKVLHQLNQRQQGYGNFYLQPNGVFYLTQDGQGQIVSTQSFQVTPQIQYATQSGPLLLVEGQINPRLNPHSTSLRIRNGVGVKENGELLFVMSRQFVSFYDFARYFQQQGCRMALYLDGAISGLYLADQNLHYDGFYGPIIAEIAELGQSPDQD